MRSRRVTSSYQRHAESISAGLQSQVGDIGGGEVGAAFMAAAARVEVVRAGLSQAVRKSELAESSRAAAVARAQQLYGFIVASLCSR